MSEQSIGPHNETEVDKVQELEDYYDWKARCRNAKSDVEAYYASQPGHMITQPIEPWNNAGFSEQDRLLLWTGGQIIDRNRRKKTFSLAASAVVGSNDKAKFFDDVKCDYLGDSYEQGKFRPINPSHNKTPFSIDFDYSDPIMSSYIDSGTILHIRETRDPSATTLAQKLFVVAANLNTMELQRLFVDSTRAKQSKVVPSHFDELITFSASDSAELAHFPVAENNPLRPYVQELFENHITQNKPQLKKSARGFSKFKPSGSQEFERLRPVYKLDQERHLLGMIALSTGYSINERGVINGNILTPPIDQ